MAVGRVGFVGTGAIADAMVTGLLADPPVVAEIVISPRNAEIAGRLAERFAAVRIAADNQGVVDGCDLLVLSIRPQVAEPVVRALRFRPDLHVLSVIAATDLQTLRTWTDADVALTQSSIFGSLLVGTPAFAGRPLFGSGPFSGRTPFPDSATGTPSTNFPPNEFLIPLQLPRVKRLAWTARLLGVAAVPELAANPLAATQPDVDMRQRYRDGLAQVNAYSTAQYGSTFDQLDPTQQDAIVKMVKSLDRSFYDLIINHTIEGMLCAPEYGGNRNGVGWQLTHFDGDSQPLGYTIFNTTTQMYVELPDKPNSTLDPDDDCSGFSADMMKLLHSALVILAGAQQFPDTPCYRG